MPIEFYCTSSNKKLCFPIYHVNWLSFFSFFSYLRLCKLCKIHSTKPWSQIFSEALTKYSKQHSITINLTKTWKVSYEIVVQSNKVWGLKNNTILNSIFWHNMAKIFFELTFELQEVPAFRDFWFQMVIMKCGDHEFRGLFLV